MNTCQPTMGISAHTCTPSLARQAVCMCAYLLSGMIVIQTFVNGLEDLYMADRKAYIPFDLPAFMQDTIHLNDKQKMLYLEMIWLQFDREIAFESAEHVRLLLGKNRSFVKHIEKLLQNFFNVLEEHLQNNGKVLQKFWQKRVKLEIDKRRLKQDEGRIHASKRNYSADGSPNAGKVSIGKVSIGKVELSKEASENNLDLAAGYTNQVQTESLQDLMMIHGESISDFSKAYPNGVWDHKSIKAFLTAVASGASPETLIAKAKEYRAYVDSENANRPAGNALYIKNAHNWLDPVDGRGWETTYEVTKKANNTPKGYKNEDMWGENARTGSNIKFRD